jgi:hypothetical protein
MAWTWTASSWRSASSANKFWRSSEFNRIETAVGKYKATETANQRLANLQAILDAISDWRVGKQESKGGKGYNSPKTSGTTGDSIAAKDDAQSLSVRSAVTDRLVQDVVAEIDAILDLERSAWGGDTFTNPATYINGSDFRFLVSAQTETAVVLEFRERTFRDPSQIANAMISATVITQDSVHLWGPLGFILSAPHQCIGAAAKGDIATRNAVGQGHAIEKYREMLRLYLGGGGVQGTGLPAPTALRRETGHNEVAVLGRSYGYTTTVNGFYLIVDQVSPTTAGIQPVTAGHVVANATLRNPPTVIPIIERLPGVSPARMQVLKDMVAALRLPIVQIPVSPAVEINGKYFPGLYGGEVYRCPLPANAVEHGSEAHKRMVADKSYGMTFFEGHGPNCPVCTPTLRSAGRFKVGSEGAIPV